MDPIAWLGIAGSLFGVAGVAGAAYAVLRSNIATRTIELWKEQNTVLEKRLATTESSVVEADKREAACTARLDVLQELVRDALGRDVDRARRKLESP